MLDFAAVQVHAKAEPFRPFRLQVVAGRTFDVRQPEEIKVGRSCVHFFSYLEEDRTIFETCDYVSLMMLESITDLDSAASADNSPD